MRNKTQKLLTIILVAVLAILGNTFMLLKSFDKGVNAEFTAESISITNGDFNQSASTFPVEPNNFTTVGTDTVSAKGIISIENHDYQTYKNKYKLANRPAKFNENFDDQMLLINAETVSSKFGYKSADLTLSANSFYEITVYVFTKVGTNASIVLSGTQFEDLDDAKFLNISTNEGWTPYTLYVQTSSIENATANLELWIGSPITGSNGFVLFDNASIKNISHSTYFYATNNVSAQSKSVSLKSNAITSENFESFDVNNDKVFYGTANTPSSEVFIANENLGTNNANMYQNEKALTLSATTAGAIGYELTSFNAERFNLYRVSIMAKTDVASGNANIILKSNNPYGEENETYTPETKTLEVNTTNLTNNTYNNWIEYAFYVKGDVFFNRTITVELWLGNDETTAVGNVKFDNFEIAKLNSADYTTGNNNDNTAELVLNTFSATPALSNDFFNFVNLEDETLEYPLVPQNWTHYEKETNSGNYGVITSSTSVDGEATPNNILLIENTNANYQYVKSVDATISASTADATTYSKFIVYAKTENANGVGASIILKSGNNVVAQFNNITSTNWQKYEFHIKNGIADQTFNLYLQLGNELSSITGKAYFDNASYKTTDETTFNNAKTANSSNTIVLDFSKEEFEITTGVKTNGLYTPSLWTASPISSNIMAGVLNTADFENSLGIQNPDSNIPNTHKNVLMIKSNDAVHYTFTSTSNYKFITDNFYKISVWVKTANISATNQDANDNNLKIGASITFTDLPDKFTGINTYDAGILESTWVEYVFYIKATTDITTNVVLSLGSANAPAKGEVYFDNITVEQTIESIYNTIEANDKTMLIGSTEIEEEEESNTPATGTNFDWILIPTLLTALALIVSIIAYYVRKSKLVKNISKRSKSKKTKFVKTENFDRQNTVVKQHEKRLNAKKVNDLIENYNAQIAKKAKEYNELELKFDAFLTETNNVENNNAITNEQIQNYIDANPQIDYDYEFNNHNQKLKQENELLFNRTFLEVSKQNIENDISNIKDKITNLKK